MKNMDNQPLIEPFATVMKMLEELEEQNEQHFQALMSQLEGLQEQITSFHQEMNSNFDTILAVLKARGDYPGLLNLYQDSVK